MKTGQVAGVKGARTDVIASNKGKIGVQLPGSRTRKIPEAGKAGGKDLATAAQVKLFPGSSGAKQTWKGPAQGYTTKAAPAYKPAMVGENTMSSGNRAKQKVK